MRLADRFALNSQTTPAADLRSFITAAAAAGFTAVECSAAVLDTERNAPRVLDTYGVEVTGACPSDVVLDWHWRWTGHLEAALEDEIARAAFIGARYFVMPFMRPQGDRRSVETGLARAVPIAREWGVRLAVEPIGHYPLLRQANEIVAVLRDQDPEYTGLLLDSFHFFRAGHNVDDLAIYSDIPVTGIQISNINATPLDESVGYRDRTFPLDGRWPITEFVQAATQLFPAAPLIVEVIGDVAASTPTRRGAELAYEQLTAIAGSADLQETTIA